MRGKLQLKVNKTLKLLNVLIYEIPSDNNMDMQKIIYMMQSYIKNHNYQTHGPIITSNYISTDIVGGKAIIKTKFILQLTEPIDSCESPYEFKPIIKIGPCLFVRFTGNPQDMPYASMKLNLYAFENDIKLEGSSYTVFVSKSEQSVTADIFMTIKKDVPLDEVL